MKKLSIIIPTYNRKVLLNQMLDSLVKVVMPFEEVEVLVIDDGSTDQTMAALLHQRDPFELRMLRHEQSQGPARARNLGARQAQGELLAFLDSDIIVDPNWWQAAAPHFDDPQVAGVEGATIPLASTTVPTPFTHIVANGKGGQFLTCNMLFRRDRFLKIGGFDERFLRANREDSDLGFSFLERGYKLIFEPQCVVRHPIVQSTRTVYFKEARFGLHEALLRRKHPLLYRRHLKWIDGRAFPVFYWGVFIGLPGFLLGEVLSLVWLIGLGLLAWAGGTAGSVYAVCRKRKVRFMDLVWLVPQFLILPWVRLFWVLKGEWRYRHVRPQVGR